MEKFQIHEEIIAELSKLLRQKIKHVTIMMPTGMGRNRLIGRIIKLLCLPTIVLVSQTTSKKILVHQKCDFLSESFVSIYTVDEFVSTTISSNIRDQSKKILYILYDTTPRDREALATEISNDATTISFGHFFDNTVQGINYPKFTYPEFEYVILYSKTIETEILEFTEVNYYVLFNIEPFFLTVDLHPGEYYQQSDLSEYHFNADGLSRDTIVDQLRKNIESLRTERAESTESDYNSEFKVNIMQLKSKLSRLISDDNQNDNQKTEKPRNIFNGIIKELCSFNYALFSGNAEPVFSSTESMPQVFLSHAYIDKLYSYALFQFFLEKGIYLYIDWMHEEAQTDSRKLKALLNMELSHSEQLLFLRTTNSELCIQGQHYIRPWCMWEIGNYYRNSNHCVKSNMRGKGREQSYLLNLYSVDRYENDLHLHGFRILESIEKSMMVGREITPARET